MGFLEGYYRFLYGWSEACVKSRCVWGRNSEGSVGFRWVFGPIFHFWLWLCRVGIFVGGDLGMIVQSGSGRNRVGFGEDMTYLGGPGFGLCGVRKKYLSLCMYVRRVETLAV